jgi:hypothetical protein
MKSTTKTTAKGKAKPAPKDKPQTPPSPLSLLSTQAYFVDANHEGIAALSLALDEIEGQYVSFSTDVVTNYVRAAIVDKLGERSKAQCQDIHDLLGQIKALGQAPVTEGGAR